MNIWAQIQEEWRRDLASGAVWREPYKPVSLENVGGKLRKKTPHKFWSKRDTERLIRLYEKQHTDSEIADVLHRSIGSIKQKLLRLRRRGTIT